MKMKVTAIPVGDLRCNCYLIEKDGVALLIDPGAELEKILAIIKDKQIKGVLITHHHFDHVGCVESLQNDYHYPIYDCHNLEEGNHKLGPFTFEVIQTFGHTMDLVTYYFEKEKAMFTGDFLFYNTIGRYDFLESNAKEMFKSIEKIKKYPDDIVIYPGHGIKTTLGREKKTNPYFLD